MFELTFFSDAGSNLYDAKREVHPDDLSEAVYDWLETDPEGRVSVEKVEREKRWEL